MHILITGAAGMIGRKLTARLVKDGGLNGKPIDRLTLVDVVAAGKTRGLFRRGRPFGKRPVGSRRRGQNDCRQAGRDLSSRRRGFG
jgi:nucleoside-diphosphate-sugar epimerase